MSENSAPEVAAKYEDLAGLIEYALVQTQLSEADVAQGCEAAKSYQVASVVVRPSDVDLIARTVTGPGVRLGAIVDLPHGYSTTSAKLYAARDLLRRGVREIHTVMNTGKLLSRQFQYLETELRQMSESCHQSGATLTVNLESEFLDEELKIVACRIIRRVEADYTGTNDARDIALLQSYSRERFKIQSHGPVLDLDAAIALRDAGAARIQVSNPTAILDGWKQKLVPATE